MAERALAEFSPDPQLLQVGEALPPPHSQPSALSAGVFAARGSREGHLVSWRASGAMLELSEVSTLPGACLRGGELSLQFSSPILPDVGISQLADDSLLLSVANRAPQGVPRSSLLSFYPPSQPRTKCLPPVALCHRWPATLSFPLLSPSLSHPLRSLPQSPSRGCLPPWLLRRPPQEFMCTNSSSPRRSTCR